MEKNNWKQGGDPTGHSSRYKGPEREGTRLGVLKDWQGNSVVRVGSQEWGKVR